MVTTWSGCSACGFHSAHRGISKAVEQLLGPKPIFVNDTLVAIETADTPKLHFPHFPDEIDLQSADTSEMCAPIQ